MQESSRNLEGRRIAIPENRQLQVLAQLLEKRGANVTRVPMVAILDAPDPTPVLAWLEDFIHRPSDLLILMTGEGLRRLLALAEKHALREDFIKALAVTDTLCRGPKPVRALREIGLGPGIPAKEPTTTGVIATLADLPLEGKRVAVQLYGEDPNQLLVDYLTGRGAEVGTVAPYVYADKADEDKILNLIGAMDKGEIDVIAFTSQPQFRRLQQVASAHGLEPRLLEGLKRTRVAVVGPVVKEQLGEAGVKVDIMPERTYFMKPMVSAIAAYLNREQESHTGNRGNES